MMGWDSSGSSLGVVVFFLISLPVGLVLSFILGKIYKNRQVLKFLSAWSLYFLILSLWFLTRVKDLIDKKQVFYLIGLSSVLSFIFLYFSYKKTNNKNKMILGIIINLIIISIVIFLLNQ
jgi:hypothetical protein